MRVQGGLGLLCPHKTGIIQPRFHKNLGCFVLKLPDGVMAACNALNVEVGVRVPVGQLGGKGNGNLPQEKKVEKDVIRSISRD